MSLVYRFLRGLIRAALGFYFSEVEVHGRDRMPGSGPLLVIANHHNGMIDPMLLIAAGPRPLRFISKSTLFKVPGLGFFLRRLECIPAYRRQDPGYAKEKNLDLYQAVADALRSGGAVALFPEGVSHTDPSLADFRHGASKMALEADSAATPLRIQPAGLHFERTRLFRGRVVVVFGEPLTLEEFRGAADPKDAVERLTARLHDRLSSLILDAGSEEQVRLAGIVDRFGLVDADEGGLKGKLDRKKRLLETWRRLRAERPAEMEGLRRQLLRYEQLLAVLGVRDDFVTADYRWGRAARFAAANTALLLLGAPFLAAGVVMNAPPFWTARLLATFGRPSADVRSSVGLLSSIALFPAWYALLGWLASSRLTWTAWVPLLAAGPLCGLLAMGWLERWRRLGHATWTLWMALRLPAARARLKLLRTGIVARLEAVSSAPGK